MITNTSTSTETTFTRIVELLYEKRIKLSDFQRKLGIKSQIWNNWRIRGVPAKWHVQIAQELGVNLDWLAAGKGEKKTSRITQPTLVNPVPTGEAMEEKVARIIRYTRKVIEESGQTLTREKINTIYKSTISLGIDYDVSEKLIGQYIKDILEK
jgi:hypothetical protein